MQFVFHSKNTNDVRLDLATMTEVLRFSSLSIVAPSLEPEDVHCSVWIESAMLQVGVPITLTVQQTTEKVEGA